MIAPVTNAPRVRRSDRLPREVPCYLDAAAGGTIVVNWPLWQETPRAQQYEWLTRECAHHVLLAVYPWRPTGWHYWSACRQEEKGRRLMLRALVSDWAVVRAFAEGDTETWQLAERWERTESFCRERVALFLIDNPGWRVLMRPE